MRGTTNFDEFFGDVGDLTPDDVHHLYEAIRYGSSVGRWNTSRKNGKTFVDGESVSLCIVDGRAQDLFFRQLQSFTDQPEMKIDDWAIRRVTMQRDD